MVYVALVFVSIYFLVPPHFFYSEGVGGLGGLPLVVPQFFGFLGYMIFSFAVTLYGTKTMVIRGVGGAYSTPDTPNRIALRSRVEVVLFWGR
jgi:hypothetical protein